MRTYTFEAGKQSYTVKFDYNAISDMEELVGEPILSFVEKGSMNMLRVLIWGGVRWKLQGITKQQAGYIIDKLIQEKKLKEVMESVSKCLQYSLKQLDGESEEEETEGE